MDTRIWLICGLAAGFLMCVAALAGSIDMSRLRMQVTAKSPICRPADALAAKSKLGVASTAAPAR